MEPRAKRLAVALITGAILGGLCIVGVSQRVGAAGNELFLFAVWFNRLLMGLVIGLAAWNGLPWGGLGVVLRGATLGAFVALAGALSTGFRDISSFVAGIAYGVVIDGVATRFGRR